MDHSEQWREYYEDAATKLLIETSEPGLTNEQKSWCVAEADRRMNAEADPFEGQYVTAPESADDSIAASIEYRRSDNGYTSVYANLSDINPYTPQPQHVCAISPVYDDGLHPYRILSSGMLVEWTGSYMTVNLFAHSKENAAQVWVERIVKLYRILRVQQQTIDALSRGGPIG